ncbi:hypothetical protein B0H34DRAFT_644945 [Crassisporium funariophilum]|nr:hypothetical protein B0H34DRAFT_644945 [Crassisporium funariophilum]
MVNPTTPFDAPYSLVLLSEYTHTLDSLPIDLSRNFADLRELDAVLSSSIISITSKILNLTTMIEQGTASKEDRLWLLTGIADEAQRLKLGGEDKIRVACQAADNLKSHSNHLRALTEHLPGFDTSVLERRTVYPHVSERSYLPTATMEGGRRRRGGFGSIMVASNPEPSPAKRKRVVRDDDIDVGSSRTPKKAAGAESNSRSRGNGRAKKIERAVSPSESVVSVTSHMPPPLGPSTSRGGNSANSRTANAPTFGGTKRQRGAANNNIRNPTPLVHDSYPSPHDLPSANHVNGSRRGAGGDNFNNVLPSAAHPSLPFPYPNGNGNGAGHAHIASAYDVHGVPNNLTNAQDWSIPRAQQLEGPGMPVARSASIHSAAPSIPILAAAAEPTDAGDGDGDGDDRTYCFCDGVSYGEMIACDDAQCEREWFHLACIGLTVPPEGRWFCETCRTKRNAKRSGRGGKRRAAGGRAGAKGG